MRSLPFHVTKDLMTEYVKSNPKKKGNEKTCINFPSYNKNKNKKKLLFLYYGNLSNQCNKNIRLPQAKSTTN